MAQAERDLEVAQRNAAEGYFEWSCFASHQAAEKAIKAVYQHLGGDARGHDLDGLLSGLADRVQIPEDLPAKVSELGKHYIAPRYPNAHAGGAPFQHYTRDEAQRAVEHAEEVIRFCRGHLA
ncbi:MAG: HEPN domain-containing protein [Chloroflexi bacterium]|nr:HEPN domain-containing protein [Chloroflexota bacterium]